MKMTTGCLRKIEKINICMKLAKIAFYLLMKIWDSVYKCLPCFCQGFVSCSKLIPNLVQLFLSLRLLNDNLSQIGLKNSDLDLDFI